MAPEVRSTSRPPAKTANVGIERMPMLAPMPGCASVFTFTTSNSPAASAASFATSGATIWHGPHHGAQKSTSTGSEAVRMSAVKLAAESMSTGSDGCGSAALQLPHWPLWCSRANGMRFARWHCGQEIRMPRSSALRWAVAFMV